MSFIIKLIVGQTIEKTNGKPKTFISKRKVLFFVFYYEFKGAAETVNLQYIKKNQ